MRTVVFDLDGTLADTSRDLISAANATLRDLGDHDILDPATDMATAFRGGRAMLRLGLERIGGMFDERDIDARFPSFLVQYEAVIDRETRLYAGAVAAIEALRAAGYATAICTNKPERLAEILIRRLGVRRLFDALIGADTLPVRKPDPAPYLTAVARAGGDARRSVLVGDTVTDRETARAAGVASILVTFGPEGDTVRDLAPDALLGHYDELGGIVRSLIG